MTLSCAAALDVDAPMAIAPGQSSGGEAGAGESSLELEPGASIGDGGDALRAAIATAVERSASEQECCAVAGSFDQSPRAVAARWCSAASLGYERMAQARKARGSGARFALGEAVRQAAARVGAMAADETGECWRPCRSFGTAARRRASALALTRPGLSAGTQARAGACRCVAAPERDAALSEFAT